MPCSRGGAGAQVQAVCVALRRPSSDAFKSSTLSLNFHCSQRCSMPLKLGVKASMAAKSSNQLQLGDCCAGASFAAVHWATPIRTVCSLLPGGSTLFLPVRAQCGLSRERCRRRGE